MMNVSCYIIGKGSLLIKAAERLLSNNHKILGILTNDNSVIEWAKENNIDFLQYKNYESIKKYLSNNEFDYLFSIVNNVFIKDDILKLPKKAAINFHDSPLPKYAGANATSWAIMENRKEHAISWHKIDNQYDSGAIFKQIKFPISDKETVFSLNAKCFENAIQGFIELLDDIENDNLSPVSQNLTERSYVSRFNNKDLEKGYIWNSGLISKEMTADEIDALIRGLDYKTYDNQLAKVKFIYNKKIYIIDKIEISNSKSTKQPGEITALEEENIEVATKSNNIKIKKITDIKNNKVEIKDFIKDNNVSVGNNLLFNNEELKNIKEFDKSISRAEDFWIDQFLGFTNSYIPYISNKISQNNECKTVKLNNNLINELKNKYKDEDINKIIFTAFLFYIRKLSKKENISI